MYTEQLYTPHPERAKGLPPVPFEDALQLDVISEELNSLIGDPKYGDTVLKHAETITQTVHRTLSFRSRVDDDRLLTPENLADGQASNCYGYTVLLSEALEKAGIRHFIGFANSHALAIVAPTEESEPWVFDALTPQFNAPLGRAVDRGAVNKATSDIQKYGRGAVKFYSRTFVQQSKFNKPFHEIAERNQWLSTAKVSQSSERNYDESDFRTQSRQVLFMSLFEPQTGREALVAHKAMSHALSEGKRADAYRAFKRLKRYYPELDIRNAPEEITHLVHELGTAGCVGMAKRVVDESMESFAISNDPRFKIWQADLYRRLGNRKAHPHLIREAIKIYEQTEPLARHPNIVKAKRRKAEMQLASLVMR